MYMAWLKRLHFTLLRFELVFVLRDCSLNILCNDLIFTWSLEKYKFRRAYIYIYFVVGHFTYVCIYVLYVFEVKNLKFLTNTEIAQIFWSF